MTTVTRKMLGQAHPTDTNNTLLYNPASGVKAIVESIMVCNVTAGALTYRIFFDDDGTTYDLTTALYYDVSLAANTTIRLAVQLAMNDDTGNVAVRSSGANGLTFTAFGTETTN